MVYRQWFAMACVGVLVDDSVPQLAMIFALHAIDLAVLLTLCPFANRCTTNPRGRHSMGSFYIAFSRFAM